MYRNEYEPSTEKGDKLDFTPFQTPSYVSFAAKDSGDITAYYKQWVRGGLYSVETEEHFTEIDRLLSEGYHWIIT